MSSTALAVNVKQGQHWMCGNRMVLAYTGQCMEGNHYYARVGELHSCGLVKQSNEKQI